MELELELTHEDEARITDTAHSIQAASASLGMVDSRKIPNLAAIKSCLRDADKTLRNVLRSFRDRVRRV